MGRSRCDDPPADPLVSKFRVLLSRVDRARSAAHGGGAATVAAAGVDPWLDGGDSLLLHDLLLAHLLDDPLRWSASGLRLLVTGSGRDCDRDLSGSGDRKSTRLNSSHGYISY